MHFSVRTITAFSCSCLVAIIAAGCGESPARPSGQTGAVIAGTVTSASGAASTASLNGAPRFIRPSASPFAGLTVRVVGSGLSSQVGDDGQFQITGVPGGTVRLQFTGNGVDVTISIQNVTADQFIEIQVQLSGSSAQIVDETRTQKVELCHKEGNGTYHLIDISESAEDAHRDHGDAMIGEPVPGRPNMIFDSTCRPVGPSVEIKKFTNGEDADNPPGPEILVGSPVTWTYIVTNTGTVPLSGIVVTDIPSPGAITCVGPSPLPPSSSITCTATGAAVLGQYSNEATVNAIGTPPNGTPVTVTDTDRSHYRGVTPEQEEEGPKVNMCHRTGAGFYVLINISVSAEPAHLAHGDGYPGQAVPGQLTGRFTATCGVQ
jgi:uncharacterized repeat protein (TIGR01451 family)